jgi:thiol:disulfide interchange protein DsbA
MRSSRLALCLGLALVLAGCGKQQSTVEGSPAGTPNPASAPTAAQTDAAAVNPKTAEQASDRPSKITRINEDGSETVEDVPSDSGVHNPLLAAVASTVAASTATASAATSSAAQWQEGVNYKRLLPAQPTEVPAGQVEVLEFFWYACPHCNAIDPAVAAWLKTKPAYVSFSRVPVMWNEGHRSLARLFYTLQALGKLDQLHSEVFKEIHVHGDPLVAPDANDAAGSEHMQAVFVRKFGISEADFTKAYHSFAVETAMQKADELGQRYRIDGVPTFVVNGKFVADVGTAGGPDRLLTLVGDLAVQEHKH